MLTFEEFKSDILKRVGQCPKEWRKGQAVFNILDEMGVARAVQLLIGVDCFYDDSSIDNFLEQSYKIIISNESSANKL